MSIHEKRLEAACLSGGISNSDIYSAALTAARRHQPHPRRILDFGSGVGDFTKILCATYGGATVAGADILPRPQSIPASVDWYEADLNAPLPVPDASFDLIFAVEVIEHLENTRQVLRELYRLLAPGGVAILTTPNTGSMRSLITYFARGHHAQFDDANYPAHITAVTELDFKRTASEAGFQSPAFFYTDVGTVPKILSLKWQNIPLLGTLFRGKLYSDNYGAVLIKA
jgi:SAM-dependent methyltransferase